MDALALLVALAFVGLNAFFVATEFAIVKVRPTRIEELLRKQKRGAATVRRVIGNIDAYLSATQLGITFASLGLGWIGEPAFARLVAPLFALVGLVDPEWTHRVSLVGAFAIITFLHIVVGELAPKSLAILRAESVALAVAYPMRVFYFVFFPAIWLLNSVARWLLRAVGITTHQHPGELPSEEEIKIIVSQARSAGLLSAERSELLRRAMALPTRTAKHLMVPRNDVVFLDLNLSLDDNIERCMQSGHTRFPLCDRELDDVLGIVDVRDVLYRSRRGAEVDLRSLAVPPAYFPEMMSAERLLAEFRARSVTMAIIVDEYGGASGTVTPADVVTAVMGELEEEQAGVVRLPGGVYEVEGTAPLEEIEAVLRVPLRSQDMRTLAGFLMERLGRMPRPGDRLVEGNYTFHVLAVTGPRVERVRIQHAEARTAGETPK